MLQRNHRHRGFTLTELLVVIGIIVILAGILLPLIGRARRNAERTRMALDLQAITTALEQYKSDAKDYPRVVAATSGTAQDKTGAQVLCIALTQPWRVRVGGQQFGPYLTDRMKVSKSGDVDSRSNPLPMNVFVDGENDPILYFPANLAKDRIDITSGKNYVEDQSDYTVTPTWIYNFADNADTIYFAGPQMFRMMLGDLNGDGKIDASAAPPESAATKGAYILYSAGPDGLYGPLDKNGGRLSTVPTSANDKKQAVERSDDVTNFQK